MDTVEWVDSGKVGVTGGSYGGYMTNWIVGHTNRFHAAVTQRSISNWYTKYGTSDIGFYGNRKGMGMRDLWDSEGWLMERSPIRYAPNVTTPILIIHSEQDYRCLLYTSIQRLNAGEPTSCDGCPELQHMYAPIQRYFTHVIYNELGRCNFRCIYCNYEDRLGRDISSDVDVRQLLGLVQQYGFDNDNGVIELCNGEITIHPHKKAIYDVVKDNNVMFLTNGFVYDEEIQRRMLDGKGVLNISLDSGTKSTFFKVKGCLLYTSTLYPLEPARRR